MADWFKIKNDMLASKGMQFAISEQPLVTSVWLVILSEASKNRSSSFSWSDSDFELIGFARFVNCSVPIFNQCLALLERIGYIKRGKGQIEITGWNDIQSDYAKGLDKGYYKNNKKKLASDSEVSTPRVEESREEKKKRDSAHFPESNVPTWEEVRAAAQMQSVPESSAKKFFDHHENNSLWINQFNRLIDWRKKLVSWAANDRIKPADKPKRNPSWPTLKDIQSVVYEKCGNPPESQAFAGNYWQFWEKKEWKKGGSDLDWRSDLPIQIASRLRK